MVKRKIKNERREKPIFHFCDIIIGMAFYCIPGQKMSSYFIDIQCLKCQIFHQNYHCKIQKRECNVIYIYIYIMYQFGNAVKWVKAKFQISKQEAKVNKYSKTSRNKKIVQANAFKLFWNDNNNNKTGLQLSRANFRLQSASLLDSQMA